MSESIEMKVAPVPDQPIGTDNKHSNELKNRSKNSAIILLDDVNKPQTSMDDKDRSSLNTEKLGISSSDGDDLEPIDMSINLYETILSIMIPYILVGCPFNYCFDRKKHSCVNSIFMKVNIFFFFSNCFFMFVPIKLIFLIFLRLDLYVCHFNIGTRNGRVLVGSSYVQFILTQTFDQ